MEPTLPTIEELTKQLDGLSEGGEVDFFVVQRAQAYASLLIALELQQINNNLEALRRGDRT